MNEIEKFELERKERIKAIGADVSFRNIGSDFISTVEKHKYSYNFSWMGRPIIQYPQDIMAMQEIIWSYKPDLIIETGIAHGGSLVFNASMLELTGKGQVVGIDIDIRKHNKIEIEQHPMFHRIKMIEGSSIDETIVRQVEEMAKGKERVIVILDSNHTHSHVLRELELYSPMVTKGGYLVVFDTIVEDMPEAAFPDRPWSIGNNPKTAVHEFLSKNDHFEIDKDLENKLLVTVAPDGYLKRK